MLIREGASMRYTIDLGDYLALQPMDRIESGNFVDYEIVQQIIRGKFKM